MTTVTAIVDTTNTDLNTLDRAYQIAIYKKAKLHLHGMSWGYREKSSADDEQQLLIDRKLNQLKCEAEKQGIETTTSQSHGRMWESYFLTLLRHQDDPTVITSYPDQHLWQQWIPSKEINKFIFDFPCNVIMVKDHKHWENKKALVLLGPELCSSSDKQKNPTMNVLADAAKQGRQLEDFGLDVFYVCVYPDSFHFPEQKKLLEVSNASSGSHMILRWGTPEEVVPGLVDELGIDLLAIDVINEKKLGRIEGKYIQHLGQKIHCDIMAVHC